MGSPLDIPVALGELVDATLCELVVELAEMHAIHLVVLDDQERVLLLHDAARAGRDPETRASAPLTLDGSLAGAVRVAAPTTRSAASLERLAAHAAALLDLHLHGAWARHMAARLHVASVAETYEELAEKNRRLGLAMERMQEVDRMKSAFLATVSHELRTPLTSVIGYSEMLLEGLAGPLTREQRDYVQVIMEKGDLLLSVISGILDVARLEAGALVLAREPVPLGELVTHAVDALTAAAQRKRITIGVTLAPRTPRACGDKDKMRQVVLHLLGNAIKFTGDGGQVAVEVAPGALARDREGQDAVRLVVRDTGIGIAPPKLERIFEPFFQVDSSSTREYGGTGLGLTLVKSYVEAQGGRVWVDSVVGQGTAFTVTFPSMDGPSNG